MKFHKIRFKANSLDRNCFKPENIAADCLWLNTEITLNMKALICYVNQNTHLAIRVMRECILLKKAQTVLELIFKALQLSLTEDIIFKVVIIIQKMKNTRSIILRRNFCFTVQEIGWMIELMLNQRYSNTLRKKLLVDSKFKITKILNICWEMLIGFCLIHKYFLKQQNFINICIICISIICLEYQQSADKVNLIESNVYLQFQKEYAIMRENYLTVTMFIIAKLCAIIFNPTRQKQIASLFKTISIKMTNT